MLSFWLSKKQSKTEKKLQQIKSRKTENTKAINKQTNKYINTYVKINMQSIWCLPDSPEYCTAQECDW